MWADNNTSRDFLNFRCIADTAAELIIQAGGSPLSMGVSGGWGIGKSSMLSLIKSSIESREDHKKYLFVEFNAWLYQGYDDARAALMEQIASALIKRATEGGTALEKAKGLLKRVDWLRMGALTAGSVAALSLGLAPIGLIGAAFSSLKNISKDDVAAADVEGADKAVQELVAAGGEAIKQDTPPAQIEALRAHFRDTIKELGITLVVLIDDLDRCLPNTTISTLEAVRLFLFLPQTAFIIAADDKMIRQAVRIHFGNSTLDDDLVTNYFDKLIQIPLRVPPLGTQEVRAYLMLLYVEKSTLPEEEKERIRVAVCRQLSETWKGKSVDFEFMEKLYDQYPVDVIRNFDLSNRLAPLLASSTHVNGNPRLIKRFLNTLWIRMAVAKNQQVVIDEPVLAKVLLFERCASADAYKYLVSKIIESNDGQPLFLKDWENAAMNETEFVNLSGDWDTPFVKNWLALSPSLAELDLRAVVYVSRETMPIITASNRMSKDARDLFDAIIVSSSFTEVFRERLRKISGRDHQLLAEELISRAHQEKSWGTPKVLYSFLILIDAVPEMSVIFNRFMQDVEHENINTAVVPYLANKPWAKNLIDTWLNSEEISKPVKNAIEVHNNKAPLKVGKG